MLNIHKNTVRNHLSWMAKHNLIAFTNRYGGRGQGVQIKVLWLERGADLAARRQRAEQYQLKKRQKREQNMQNYKRVQQDKQRLIHPTGDLKNRAMKTIRTILKDQIKHPLFARHATNAFGLWIKRCQPTAEALTTFIERLRAMKRLPVPQWCKKVPDVYRWIRGLITNLIVYPDWQERFEARAEVKRYNKSLKAMQKAVMDNKPCPICKESHTQDDFEYGEDENRQRNCAGWLREQRADALKLWHQPPPLIPRQV